MVRSIEYTDHKKHQRTCLDGLKRYKDKGVCIIIDEEECPKSDRERILEMGENSGFYMGDCVGAEQGCLREIWFNKVYLCDPLKKRRKE